MANDHNAKAPMWIGRSSFKIAYEMILATFSSATHEEAAHHDARHRRSNCHYSNSHLGAKPGTGSAILLRKQADSPRLQLQLQIHRRRDGDGLLLLIRQSNRKRQQLGDQAILRAPALRASQLAQVHGRKLAQLVGDGRQRRGTGREGGRRCC